MFTTKFFNTARMGRAAIAVTLALASAAPAQAEPLFGTTGDVRGVWSFHDNQGGHIGEEADCIRDRNPAFCGPGHLEFTTAFASGTAEQQLGFISTHLQVAAPATHARQDLVSTAEFRGFWFDTFTIDAPTLAFGTPIDVRLRIDLDGPVVLPSSTGNPGQRLQAQINLGGPDAPGSAFTKLLASGANSTENHLQILWDLDPTSSHSTFTLFGGLFAFTDMSPPLGVSDSGEILGSARYFVDILTPGATLTNASGHDFSVPRVTVGVPEPASLLLLLVGGLGLYRRPRGARR